MTTEKRLVYASEVEEIFNYVEHECSDSYNAFKVAIEKATSVDAVEVVHGRWEKKKHVLFGCSYDYVCSVCSCDYALAEYNYCPNCGAKMDGERNNK